MNTIAAILLSGFIAASQVPAQAPMEYVGTFTVSAYNYSEGGGENYFTAGGYEPVPYYTCAASDAFEIGEILYIDGIGEVQVQDRGNFPDDWIDLHIGYDEIDSFDMREREVYRP